MVETAAQKPISAKDELDNLCAFVERTTYSQFDQRVRQHAKLVWMDTMGVILAGSLEPQAAALRARLAPLATGQATILAPGFAGTDPMNAALLNGTAGLFLELDEGHRPTGHPAIYIIPALLALGEELGTEGERLIEALVLGYEVTMRIVDACSLSKAIHPHSSLGAVAAAAASAKLMGFNAKQIRHAISMAASLTLTGQWDAAFEGALVRNLYSGMGSHIGILCTHFVMSGFGGTRQGLASAFNSILGSDFQPHLLTRNLGREYQITTNYFKFHAACRHAHAPVDALNAALTGRSLDPSEIDRVTVVSHYPATRCAESEPANTLAAKFSIPFAIATAIVHGSSGVDAFRQDAVEDRATRSLAQRVELVEDASFNRRFPEEDPARVEVHLRNGQQLLGFVDHPHSDTNNQPTVTQLMEKFIGLTSPVLSREGASKAAALFLGMEQLQRADKLTALMRRLNRSHA